MPDLVVLTLAALKLQVVGCMNIVRKRCFVSSSSRSSALSTSKGLRKWLSQGRWQRAYSSSQPSSSESNFPSPERYPHPCRRNQFKPYYVTSPMFYPNAAPHIGHLYSLVIADIYARHARLALPSRKVRFITGLDEHGMKIQKTAKDKNVSPIELCDHLSHAFTFLAMQAGIGYTKFVRTTAEKHCNGVTKLWDDLYNSGYIYKGKHAGWYSISDETFYTDLQVHSKFDQNTVNTIMVASETGSVVEWTEEENYKFTLSKFKTQLREHFTANPDTIYPLSQRSTIMDILNSPDDESLPDLSISRPASRLTWGISVPGDSSQTIYVWLDALTSYLTGIGYPWINGQKMRTCGWPVDLQIIGKDILKFHALYFPAFLMALDMPLPRSLLSHAHWTVEKQKMSKSVGNVIDPIVVLKEHGVDAVRWFLARAGGRFKDDIDWNGMAMHRFEVELRSLGNLFLRIQSRKILDKLPAAFHEIPLHRGILMTRRNASIPLYAPGTPEYDDIAEDRMFIHEFEGAQNPGGESFYAKEYLEKLNRVNPDNETISETVQDRDDDVPHMSHALRRMAVSYSELPEATAEEEKPIVSMELRDALDMLRGKVSYHLQQRDVSEATQSIVDVITLLNKEFTRIAPWSPDVPARDVIHLLTWARETLRICAILLRPFIPKASQALLDAMHVHGNARNYENARIGGGRVRSGPLKRQVLFPTKEQRDLEEVATDHQGDENISKKKQLRLPRKVLILHEPRREQICNMLYRKVPNSPNLKLKGLLVRRNMTRSVLKRVNILVKERPKINGGLGMKKRAAHAIEIMARKKSMCGYEWRGGIAR